MHLFLTDASFDFLLETFRVFVFILVRPKGFEPPVPGVGELRHPNRNGVQARFLVAFAQVCPMRKTPAKPFPMPVGGSGSQIVVSPAQSWRYAALLGIPLFVASSLFRGLCASQSTDPCSLKRKLMPYTAKVKGAVLHLINNSAMLPHKTSSPLPQKR